MKIITSKKYNFDIKEIGEKEWETLWPLFNYHNLQQSWGYGEAKCETSSWKFIHFLIKDNYDNPIAIVQVLYKSYGILGVLGRVNKGPLMNYGSNLITKDIYLEVIECLLKEIRKRNWRIIFLAPDIEKESIKKSELKSIGLIFRKKSAWASLKISLNYTEEVLMKNLKSKWRNLLRKAIKSNLIIEHWNQESYVLEELIKFYEDMQKEKKFTGISSDLIKSLSTKEGPSWAFNLYKATIKDKENKGRKLTVGMLLSIRHGDTETYTIGITNKTGRLCNANYLLLWNSILESKRKGCRWFDLGGLNKNTPKGIAHFKKGTNGIPYELIGETYYVSILSYLGTKFLSIFSLISSLILSKVRKSSLSKEL